MSDNPYRVEGPAIISFSGGRTSAYLLWRVLEAYGGEIPDDMHVTFANTGKEREETLRFVHECATHWGVKIRWLEYRRRERGEPWGNGFVEVGYNSASRHGEPFDAAIAVKGFLPNPMTRYCTIELKVRVMKCFARALGWTRWNSVIGLRADEMRRVTRAISANESNSEPWTAVMPMATNDGRATLRDVSDFWQHQPFDLKLKPFEGNCDICFLKSRSKQQEIIRQHPELAEWWVSHEASGISAAPNGNRFRMDRTFGEMQRQVDSSPILPIFDDAEEFDAECGLFCEGDLETKTGQALNRGCGKRRE